MREVVGLEREALADLALREPDEPFADPERRREEERALAGPLDRGRDRLLLVPGVGDGEAVSRLRHRELAPRDGAGRPRPRRVEDELAHREVGSEVGREPHVDRAEARRVERERVLEVVERLAALLDELRRERELAHARETEVGGQLDGSLEGGDGRLLRELVPQLLARLARGVPGAREPRPEEHEAESELPHPSGSTTTGKRGSFFRRWMWPSVA